MGIERGAAASQSSAAVAQRTAAGKAGGQPGASGDFTALMAALEDGPGLRDDALQASLPGQAGGDGRHGEDTQGPVLLDPLAVAAVLPVPVVATIEAAPRAGAGRAADSGRADPAADGAPGPAAVVGAAEGRKLATDALVGSGASTAHQGKEAGAPAASAAAASASPAAPVAAAVPAAAGDPRLAPQYASVFEQLQQHLAAREAATPESALRPAPLAATVQSAQARELRDAPRAERGVAALAASAVRAEAAGVAGVQDLAAAGGASSRSTGSDGGGAGQPGAGQAGVAGWSAPDFTPTVHYDAALGSLDGALQPEGALDRQVAEQLRQWVSQGVRSAELTVGTSEPVQVRIALDGNEAQVQFRAEHAATRDMLAGTVDQLRDLLGAEGLVLSGVSVGGGDAGTGRNQGDDGAAARAALLRPGMAQPEPAGESAAAVPRRPAGVLDLYV